MRSRDEVNEKAAALPADLTLDPGASVHLTPLEVPRGADLVAVTLDSAENVGCILEHQEGDAWRAVSAAIGRSIHVAAALEAVPGAWRVRLWSLDGRGERLRLRAAAAAPHLFREAELRGGIALAPMRGLPSLGAAAVDLKRIGVLRVHDGAADAGSLLQAGGPGQAFEISADGQLVALARRVFWIGGVGGRVTAERVALSGAHGAGTVKVRLSTGALASVDVTPASAVNSVGFGPTVVIARSLALQPGVGTERSGRGLAVGVGAAATVTFGRADSVAVWNAESPAPGDVELSVGRPQLSAPQTLGWGVHSGTLAVGSAAQFQLPAGMKRLVLTLGEHTVGVLANGDALESVHWRGGEAFEERLSSAASRLVLLREGEVEPRLRIGWKSCPSPPAERERTVSFAPESRSSGRSIRAGSVRLAVERRRRRLVLACSRRRQIDDLPDRGRPRSAGAISRRRRQRADSRTHGQGMVVAWVDASSIPAIRGSRRRDPAPRSLPMHRAWFAQWRASACACRSGMQASSISAPRLRSRRSSLVPPAPWSNSPRGSIPPCARGRQGLSRGRAHALAGGQLAGAARLTTGPVVPLEEG